MVVVVKWKYKESQEFRAVKTLGNSIYRMTVSRSKRRRRRREKKTRKSRRRRRRRRGKMKIRRMY